MRVFLSALGCRLNEAEIETWGMKFGLAGHSLVETAVDADVIVLNTCAVTAEAVRKSRKSIQRLQRENPSARMVVSGCYVTLDTADAQACGIDLVIPNDDKDELVRRCHEQFADGFSMPIAATSPAASLFQRHRQRAFIKVQDGCRYRCTFCIVTVARGAERSRPPGEIIDEINQLVSTGIQEIVLTGVHVGGYGSDLQCTLYQLVEQILRDTDIPRIRFASVEPWDLEDNFFTLFENPRLLPHMHLPLQSGCDAVLKRMARRCKTADFSALLHTIRSAMPHFNITTDIIVGFPGETECEWQQSLDYIAAQDFGHIHIFTYSLREGTKAARLPDQVHGRIKRQRSRALHAIAAVSQERVMQRQLSLADSAEILWESGKASPVNGKTRYQGYTPNYLRVQTDVDPSLRLDNALTRTILHDWNSVDRRLVGINHEILQQPEPVPVPRKAPTIMIHPVSQPRPQFGAPPPETKPAGKSRSKLPGDAAGPQRV
ncbi:MAG: tRNA (N(6)-L-threonylcarbamoyladenosine(37)-C(2))-methylthiotransferase MtaB [Gammaproteobacteria bacterium]|nr:tRNA (N(6)-L-threonylcarbamoyladenosine(37)-C(2))-methylthiotransferase MtaB [Gammaproteobacteria bacterium]